MPHITEEINSSLSSCEGCFGIAITFGAVVAYEI